MRPILRVSMLVIGLALGGTQVVQGASLCTGAPSDLVIITTSDLVSAFDGYVNTKNAAGLATTVCAVSDIVANYSGADTAEKIRNYIIDAYNTWAISYVILGGDEDHIPAKFYSGVSDNYYYNLTGSNPFFGAPTVLGGRLPGKTYSQTRKIANQWAAYDGKGAWARNMLYCTWAADELAGLSKFNGTVIPDTGDTAMQIISQINPGKGMVTYFGHGWEGGWSTCSLNYVNIQALANGVQLPYVVAGACRAGDFTAANSFAEAIFDPPAGGVIAYAGSNKDITVGEGAGTIYAIFNAFKASYFDHGKVRPSATFFLSVNTLNFNFLGDPTAEMDFRLPGDVTPPLIAAQQVGPAMITAYQSVSTYATITDNDEVSSHVWLQVTKPDASQVHWSLSRSGYTSLYSGMFSDTGQTGSYSCTLHAKDISGNERMGTPMVFTVQADIVPPVVAYLDVTPTQAGPFTPITIEAGVTDDSHAPVNYTLTVTKPNLAVDVLTGVWYGAYTYTDTGLAGLYKVQAQFQDKANNATPATYITNVPPDFAFTIEPDTQAPVIAGAWIVNPMGGGFPHFPGDKRITTAAAGSMVTFWTDAQDNMTPTMGLTSWADVQAPDNSVTRTNNFMWAGSGAYPPATGFNSMPFSVSQTGFYSVTITVKDQVGNTAQAYAGQLSVYVSPSDLTATAVSNQVNLTWAPAQSGYPITGYNLFRSLLPAGNTLTPTNALPIVGCAYSDSAGLVNGTTYYYCVGALDAQGNTCGVSGEVSVVPNSIGTPTPTSTISTTATISPTLTPSRTVTLSPTPTPTHSQTPTSTRSATATLTRTTTTTPTITQTKTPSASVTPTGSASPTPTITLTHTTSVLNTYTCTTSPTLTLTVRGNADVSAKHILAYPNPARDQITFTWDEPNAESVTLRVYNLSGERIAVLHQNHPAGSLVWACAGVAPGIYMYQTVLTLQGREQALPVNKVAIIR